MRSSPEQRRARADALLASSAQPDGPGAAVLVTIDDEVAYQSCRGLANLDLETPITPRTNFRLASISKQITAMAIMILAEDGRLTFDDRLVQHVPELAVYGPDITLRHLLNHTAGLPEVYHRLASDSPAQRPSNTDLVNALAKAQPQFRAGQRFEYCNVCYDVLALVVERASGLSFDSFLDQRIFTPLDMDRSSTFLCPSPAIETRALGYRPHRGRFLEFDADPLNCILGAGGIYSNLEDMQRWLQGLDNATLVSRDTLQEAFTKGTLTHGETVEYGFGWALDSYRGLRRQSHTGSWVGFRNYIARFPEVGLSIIVLSNHSDFDRLPLVERLADVYLDQALAASSPQG